MIEQKLHIGHLLFKTNGRIDRATWWISQITLLFLTAITTWIWNQYGFHDAIYGMVGTVLMFWIRININIKRLHDHGKSGWWILFYEIPVIGTVWGIIVLGCLKGSDEENQHGAAFG